MTDARPDGSTPAGTAHRGDYLRDGAEIYRHSFATIRAEADLSAFPDDVETVVVRMIHGSGQVDLAGDIAFTADVVASGRAALQAGAPILCDANMIAAGITRKRLPADNEVLCTLSAPRVAEAAEKMGTTRSAAALELWGEKLGGAVVAIGNAPTALFHLLDMLDRGAPRPAAIVGGPVGFIGAAESKQALIEYPGAPPFMVVRGRRGGSAIAVSAVNAIATPVE